MLVSSNFSLAKGILLPFVLCDLSKSQSCIEQGKEAESHHKVSDRWLELTDYMMVLERTIWVDIIAFLVVKEQEVKLLDQEDLRT